MVLVWAKCVCFIKRDKATRLCVNNIILSVSFFLVGVDLVLDAALGRALSLMER